MNPALLVTWQGESQTSSRAKRSTILCLAVETLLHKNDSTPQTPYAVGLEPCHQRSLHQPWITKRRQLPPLSGTTWWIVQSAPTTPSSSTQHPPNLRSIRSSISSATSETCHSKSANDWTRANALFPGRRRECCRMKGRDWKLWQRCSGRGSRMRRRRLGRIRSLSDVSSHPDIPQTMEMMVSGSERIKEWRE